MRNAFQLLIVNSHASGTGQTDIGIVCDEFGAVAIAIERGLEVAQAGELVRCPGQLYPTCDLLHMMHQNAAVHGLAEVIADRIAHRSLPRATSRSGLQTCAVTNATFPSRLRPMLFPPHSQLG